MTNTGEAIIRVSHINKTFGANKAIDDVSLEIKKGEFVTILGPSGCGKTTLLRIIGGFTVPDEGTVYMDGRDVSDVPPYKRNLNTVFQKYALFPHLDVYDNIAFGLKLKKLPDAEIDRKVRRVLKMVTLTDYEDRDVDSLSGGQQQRVAIARALVNDPEVLLLDEPLSALDLKMRKDMQIELKEMHQKLGITFIYVTHDQEEALTLSDTICVMNEGRIQQIGTPMDIYNEPVNSFVADFIGESNILNGRMISDRHVEFIAHEFECVDEGFGCDVPVDVVVRPEDIYIIKNTDAAQFTGTVRTCTFKGVHYEMFVDTAEGYEMMIQDYNAFEVGSTVGMMIRPQDIQVMRKEAVQNVFEGVVVDTCHVSFAGGVFETLPHPFEQGASVNVSVAFDKVDLLDNKEDGVLMGEVSFILYKGDHYHLTVLTSDKVKLFVDTDDVWDRSDIVGVGILPEDIRLSAR